MLKLIKVLEFLAQTIKSKKFNISKREGKREKVFNIFLKLFKYEKVDFIIFGIKISYNI